MSLDLRTSELEHHFIQERINNVEKHVSEICSQFANYNKKSAHLRDSGDELAKTILNFASTEMLNQTLRAALTRFSDIMSAIQDYRDTEVQRLDAKVLIELSSYGVICKQAKEELKKSFAARAKELSKKNQLEKMRGKKPTNWQHINQAEREANRAREEATQATFQLSQQIDSFEERKLDDFKRVFLEFVNIELLFHTKALELYTKAYSAVSEIKKDNDLQEFRNRFRAPYAAAANADLHRSALESPDVNQTIPKTITSVPLKSCLSSARKKTLSSHHVDKSIFLGKTSSHTRRLPESSTSLDITDDSMTDSRSISQHPDASKTFKAFRWGY